MGPLERREGARQITAPCRAAARQRVRVSASRCAEGKDRGAGFAIAPRSDRLAQVPLPQLPFVNHHDVGVLGYSAWNSSWKYVFCDSSEAMVASAWDSSLSRLFSKSVILVCSSEIWLF